MGIITTYFVALYLSIKSKKSLSNTVPLSIMALILVEYIFANLGFMKHGVYACLGINAICLVLCLIHFFRDYKNVLSILFSPTSLAFMLYVVLFCVSNIGRGFADSDDMLVWGLNIKNMCYYDVISSPVFTNISDYPRATMMWEYFANKTWLGFAEGVTLWAYDVYIASLMLPLYDFIKKDNKIVKFFCIFLTTLILPYMTYGGIFSRLCANSLTALLLFWSFYNTYEYWKDRFAINYISVLFTLFVIPLTIRAGVLLTFGIVAFMSFVLFEHSKYHFCHSMLLKALLMAAVCSASYATYASESYYIGIVVSLVAIIVGTVSGIIVENRHKINSLYFIEPLVIAIFVFGTAVLVYIKEHATNGGMVITYFFEHLFLTNEGTVINFFPVPIFAIFIGLGVLLYVYHYKLQKEGALTDERRKQIFVGLFLLLSICEILFAYLWSYAFYIGVEPGMKRLPSFNRYMAPCILVPTFFLIIFFLKELSDKYGLKLYVMIALASILLVDCSKPVSDFLNKYELPQYNAFDAAGIELTSNDKVFYIYLYDDSGIYTDVSFYYQVMPAISNYNRAYAGKADLTITGSEEDTSEFGKQLVALGYNYVYIQTINDDFCKGYSYYFENPSEIYTGCVYRVVQKGEKIILVRCV